jgi:hypothetical protein
MSHGARKAQFKDLRKKRLSRYARSLQEKENVKATKEEVPESYHCD